jgi:hypothetical protein
VLFHILPFMEQVPMWNRVAAGSNSQVAWTTAVGYRASDNTIKGYLCPSDPNPPETGTGLPTGNYAPNGLVFGNSAGGDYAIERIGDGSSNCVGVCERRGETLVTTTVTEMVWPGFNATGNLANNGGWVNTNNSASRNTALFTGTTANFNADTLPYFIKTSQFSSVSGANGGDPQSWHGIHTGGIVVGMMDGKVDFRSEALSAATSTAKPIATLAAFSGANPADWAKACHPNDGLTFGTDWNR